MQKSFKLSRIQSENIKIINTMLVVRFFQTNVVVLYPLDTPVYRDESSSMGIQGKCIFWGPLTPNQGYGWLVG